MKYDFETLSPAHDKCPQVWSYIRGCGISDSEAISYAIAELKFPLAPEIRSALHTCVDDGYFGYAVPKGYDECVCGFMRRRHGWNAEKEWLIHTYGIVSAISMAIRAFTGEGEGVIIQEPVYNPFAEAIRANGRSVLVNSLIRKESRYEMDFEDLERLASLSEARLMVLCSPHNPVGRVWTAEELRRVSEICARNGVIVVSDEIHNDLVYGAKHTVFAALSKEAEQNCLVCTAPSKSFNIPGLITSNIFVPNAELRQRFEKECTLSMGHFLNIAGTSAGIAAYEQGCGWLDELCGYLAENAEYFRALVAEKLPQAWTPKMEGTYLAWLDLSYLGLDDAGLEKLIIEKAQCLVNMGRTYGCGGSGFVRINIGCPRRYVADAVERIAKAINDYINQP